MEKRQLETLVASLSLEEKVGQLIQLSGDFFDETINTTETGPSKKIGLDSSYNLYDTGSVLNVLDPEMIRTIQGNYLAKSRHKIPLVFMTDIIYGFNTIFPIPIAQSCSWDFDLIKEGASISAEEAYYAGQQVTFSPMVDLVRDPRWGRVMESPGEDPYIGSNFSRSVVEGLQGEQADAIKPKKLAACVKHFAAYGAAEAGRDYNLVDMSLSKFYGYYLPAFKAAVDAKVKLVMTAFNTLNGVPCTGNKWLNHQVLREELQFNGVLITDYAANEELISHGYVETDKDAAKAALEATVDIDMKTAIYANSIKTLVEEGALEIGLVDQAVLRVLELKNDLGLFENPYRGLTDTSLQTDRVENLEKALELAEKSAVLLKNNGVLPLSNEGKIAIIGPYADNPNTLGMWAINGDTSKTITLKSGMEQVFEQADITVAEGAVLVGEEINLGFSNNIKKVTDSSPKIVSTELLNEALAVAKDADKIIVAFGEHMLESGEAGSKTKLDFAKSQLDLIDALSQLNKPLIGVVYSGRPNNLSTVIDKFDALLYAWYPGTMGGLAVANLLSGTSNPSGKLTMSFPRNEGQIPIYYNGYSTGRPIISSNENQRFTSRYIDESNGPLFTFGFGLSYAQFEYRAVTVSSHQLKNGERIDLQVEIENVSNRDGDEIIQLYVKDVVSSLVRPMKELKVSKRIAIEAQSTKVVEFSLSAEDLTYYDNEGNCVNETGVFELFIGGCADNTPLSLQIELH